MKINHTSIVKAFTTEGAILDLINETFSKVYIEIFINGLVVDGEVGTVIEVEKDERQTRTTTNYFIVTNINSLLKRVEHCNETVYKYNDPELEKLMHG